MQDILHRLYRLTLSQKKLQTEDFVSLCLGRHLENDIPLLDFLVDRIAAQLPPEEADPLKGWRACTGRSVEVRAQVLARTPTDRCPGWADLVLGLKGQDTPARVVLEAKVGHSFPKPEQLARYHLAFGGALVVPLVERRAVVEDAPAHLTWDDVLHGLGTTATPPGCEPAREDLRKLLLDASVGDPRLALTPEDHEQAHAFESTFHRLRERMQSCLIQMGANTTLRAHIAKRLASEDHEAWPDEGWGTGFQQDKAIKDTRVRGLALGVRASSFADELVWQLEVRVAGKKLPKWMNSPESEWRQVPGLPDWFVTELHRTRGTSPLRIDDFRALIESGRLALRRLHRSTNAGKWASRGQGEAPHAPRQSMPEIRAGLLAWEPVSEAIDRTITDILSEVCAEHDNRKRPFRAQQGGAWRTFNGALPEGVRLTGTSEYLVTGLQFTLDPAPADAPERFAEALEAWPADLQRPVPVSDNAFRLALDGATFCHRSLVTALVALLSALVSPA